MLIAAGVAVAAAVFVFVRAPHAVSGPAVGGGVLESLERS